MSLRGRQSGQAAVELVAAVPIVIVLALGAGQAAVAGYALWAAGNAARAGARAEHVGGDRERAALSALPGWLAERAEIDGGARTRVRLEAPALIPGLPAIPVQAAASLDPGAGADG